MGKRGGAWFWCNVTLVGEAQGKARVRARSEPSERANTRKGQIDTQRSGGQRAKDMEKDRDRGTERDRDRKKRENGSGQGQRLHSSEPKTRLHN